MKSAHTLVLATSLAATVCAAGCGGGPTGPSGTRQPAPGTASPASGETFTVSGIVSDEQGAPVVAAPVAMAHWLGGRLYRPTVLTDAAGHYVIEFTANPWTEASGRMAARAEIIADGYDWYYKNVLAADAQLGENFRLSRLKRIAAGDSAAVSVTPENGDCIGSLYNPCGRLRITVPDDGNLTIDAVATQDAATRLQLVVCCLNGNEQYGNPVTLRVGTGDEVWVEVGQSSAAAATGQTVNVNTSLQPF